MPNKTVAITELDLKDLQIDDLERLSNLVSRVLEDRLHSERLAVEKRILDEAQRYGIDLSKLGSGRSASRRAQKGPAKYADPTNPVRTWTGTGRQPAWVRKHIDAGGTLDDLLIQPIHGPK